MVRTPVRFDVQNIARDDRNQKTIMCDSQNFGYVVVRSRQNKSKFCVGTDPGHRNADDLQRPKVLSYALVRHNHRFTTAQ